MPIKKTPAKKPAPTRRSPIARPEGERRLIEAADTLIHHKPFSEVSLREIALLADVNHRFVHAWFGSKNDLLHAVARQKFRVIAENVSKAEPGAPGIDFWDAEVRLAVRLIIWLDIEGFDTRGSLDNMPIVEALTQRFIEVEKIDPSIAREAATQAITIGLGAGTFGPILGIDDVSKILPIMKLWRHIVGLLAEHPPK